MRRVIVLVIALALYSCDESRVYEKQTDFNRVWITSDKPSFEFEIKNHTEPYNLYYTVRNSLDFPFSRIFITYTLTDSSGLEMKKDLIAGNLFDQKTGEPFGSSGLGDLYDHRFPLLMNYKFERPGVYSISLEQFTRKDTLEGVLAVGVRVEKSLKNQ